MGYIYDIPGGGCDDIPAARERVLERSAAREPAPPAPQLEDAVRATHVNELREIRKLPTQPPEPPPRRSVHPRRRLPHTALVGWSAFPLRALLRRGEGAPLCGCKAAVAVQALQQHHAGEVMSGGCGQRHRGRGRGSALFNRELVFSTAKGDART